MNCHKHLIAAAALTIFALPAAAAPVELVCKGTLHWYGENYHSQPVDGVHIRIGDSTVQVSGTLLYSAAYALDRGNSDAALVMFDYGLWGGSINRYSGELGLYKFKDTDRRKMEHSINATCGKADPLF